MTFQKFSPTSCLLSLPPLTNTAAPPYPEPPSASCTPYTGIHRPRVGCQIYRWSVHPSLQVGQSSTSSRACRAQPGPSCRQVSLRDDTWPLLSLVQESAEPGFYSRLKSRISELASLLLRLPPSSLLCTVSEVTLQLQASLPPPTASRRGKAKSSQPTGPALNWNRQG